MNVTRWAGLMLFLAACNNNNSQKPIDSVVISTIESYTGKSVPAVRTPPLRNARWETETADENGIRVIVRGEHFGHIDRLFREILGVPWEIKTNEIGSTEAVFYNRSNAYGIWVMYRTLRDQESRTPGVLITIIKPNPRKTPTVPTLDL